MNTFDHLLHELRNLGYPKEKIDELMKVGSEEIQDELFEKLGKICTDDEVDAFDAQAKQVQTQEQREQFLWSLARRAYGNTAKEKFEEMMAEFLRAAIQMTRDVKKTAKAFQTGDHGARKLVEDAMRNPDVKRVEEELKRQE